MLPTAVDDLAWMNLFFYIQFSWLNRLSILSMSICELYAAYGCIVIAPGFFFLSSVHSCVKLYVLHQEYWTDWPVARVHIHTIPSLLIIFDFYVFAWLLLNYEFNSIYLIHCKSFIACLRFFVGVAWSYVHYRVIINSSASH